MKAYQTIKLIEHSDVGDIQDQARKSSVGRFAEKGGDYKSYTRNAQGRKVLRRYLKRKDKAQVARTLKREENW